MANFTTKKTIGDKICYFVAKRNFVELTDKTTPTLEEAFAAYKGSESSGTKILIYEYSAGEYLDITNNKTETTLTRDSNKYYYFEDGTKEIPCPVCWNNGAYNENSSEFSDGVLAWESDNSKTITCPKCNGTGKLIRILSPGTEVIALTISKSTSDAENLYHVTYRTIPPGATKTSIIKEEDLII